MIFDLNMIYRSFETMNSMKIGTPDSKNEHLFFQEHFLVAAS